MSHWINFLRQYGPIPRNDNMYDETIQRSARRKNIKPISFVHPMEQPLLDCMIPDTGGPQSVVLTGTAGDGKTHLCRQVWERISGGLETWSSDDPYLIQSFNGIRYHLIRDLSAWAPQQGVLWTPDKLSIINQFCQVIRNPTKNDIFLIAANDGQLIESWRRLGESEEITFIRDLFEELLVEGKESKAGIYLRFLNLSKTKSGELLERALNALLTHPEWQSIMDDEHSESEFFGINCPIRRNYELLCTDLVQKRLKSLMDLSNLNGVHIPIRQILLLLSNALLGHPAVKDNLMVPADIPKVISSGIAYQASLYNNLFGGNLSENRRKSISIFEYLERFQIGQETSNRIDNILIFGQDDEHLGQYFDTLVERDRFYGADPAFYAAKQDYLEGVDEREDSSKPFLQMLVTQRRGLFFKIPEDKENELTLWDLTVFRFAGEYLEGIVRVLQNNEGVRRPLISRLVKGLNRVFTGMLMSTDRDLYLATSGNYSQAKISRILLDRISVEPSKGEKVVLKFDTATQQIVLSVYFSPTIIASLNLSLIRYEFLSRIAIEGALPASFSKECYEDLLSFKSRLIAAYHERQNLEPKEPGSTIELKILSLTDTGIPDQRSVEIVR